MERGEDTVNTSKRQVKIIYLPWGPEMLNSSPMLGSVYSRVKEPLRNTLSKYKTINKERKRHRGGIGIRGRGGKIRINRDITGRDKGMWGKGQNKGKTKKNA